MKAVKSLLGSRRSFYLLLFILCILPEAIFLGKHGFYWDDWSQLFLHIKFGDPEFWHYFSYNRPGSAWTHILFFPLCGSSPIRWHLLLLFLKFCLVICFRAVMLLISPRHSSLIDCSSIFFAVCPLFSQDYISVAYSQHYTDHLMFFISVYALLRFASCSERAKRTCWYIVSMISMVLHLMISEYFVFQEILKFPLLWIYYHNNGEKDPFRRALLTFIPHFILSLAYCVFRLNITFFFPQFGAETPELLYQLQNNFLSGIRSFLTNAAADMLYPFTGFISRLFDFDIRQVLTLHELRSLLLSVFLGCVCYDMLNAGDNKTFTLKDLFPFALFGITGMFLGILPFWVMNENFLITEDTFHADRWFMAAKPFFAILCAAAVSYAFPTGKRRAAAAGLLVFLFMHGQLAAGHTAELNTLEQNEFYHQLSERIPGLRSGTAITDDSVIFPEQGNFATASALNVMYDNPIRENGDVPLWVFSYDKRKYEEHGGFHVQNRNYHFDQPPSDYIYIDHDNKFSNCVWIFGPEDTDNPHISDLQRGWISSSDLSRIDTDATPKINTEIFGTPQNNWCFYYEKSALLRQKEQWGELADLAHSVIDMGFSPSDNRSNAPFEWWPFIEGLYRTGATDLARSIADEAVRTDPAYLDFFAGRFSHLNKAQ